MACCRFRGHDNRIATLLWGLPMGRKFSREFKPHAVKLVRERGGAVAPTYGAMDGAESVLQRWMGELAPVGHREQAPGTPALP